VRRFDDPEGRSWDLVVGRESWGSFVALFVPRGDGGKGVREAPLDAPARDQAEKEVGSLDREGVLRLFRSSRPKNVHGSGEGR